MRAQWRTRRDKLIVICDCLETNFCEHFLVALSRVAGLEGISRNDFLNLGARRRAIDTHGCTKLIQLTTQGRPFFQRSTCSLDLVTRCGNNILVLIEELLVELFAVTQTCEPNLHIILGFSRKADQSASQIDDSYWFAHIQYQNVTMVANRESLQDQCHSF